LSSLNSQMSKLNSMVNQSLSIVKKEQERFRLIQQDKLLEEFKKQNELKKASSSKASLVMV